jgi:hypothetical protein
VGKEGNAIIERRSPRMVPRIGGEENEAVEESWRRGIAKVNG